MKKKERRLLKQRQSLQPIKKADEDKSLLYERKKDCMPIMKEVYETIENGLQLLGLAGIAVAFYGSVSVILLALIVMV